MAPVEGVVTLNGQPLVDATVTFTPTQAASDMNLTSFGRTDNEGKYSLETMMEGKRGALVGKHSVRIALNIEEEEDGHRVDGEDLVLALEELQPSVQGGILFLGDVVVVVVSLEREQLKKEVRLLREHLSLLQKSFQ